jgi:hypothetical protein
VSSTCIINRRKKDHAMPRVSDVFVGRFFRAGDLVEPRVLKINGWSTEIAWDQEVYCLSFDGTKPLLKLNQTNAKDIATLLGRDEMGDWVGSVIELYVETTTQRDAKTGGTKTLELIRVRAPTPKPAGNSNQSTVMPAKPAAWDELSDDIPF